MASFEGKRILLVEDEFIVAAMAEDFLSELGATVVGPAATIAKGLDLVATQDIDAAVLDVNINGERVDAVADALRTRDIPIVFASGYGEAAVTDAQDAQVLDKPYTQEGLADALARAMRAAR